MSNTTISPSGGAVALAAAAIALTSGLMIVPSAAPVALTGAAGTMGLAIGVGGGATLSGIAATVAAVSPIAPAFGGMPLSWSALGAAAAGAAVGPLPFSQARITVSGTFGLRGAALIEASPDNVNWTILAGMTDSVSPGAVLGEAPGLRVTPIGGGVVVSVTDPTANSLRYLRPVVQNGDGATSLNVTGNVSTTGSV